MSLAVALGTAMPAHARSITGVELVSSAGEMSLNVTFEAGETGDSHALYIAYDTEDKGDTLASWAALQRGCNVAAGATAATIPVSPLLTGEGYKVCRVFLTTSAAPYDTLIESLRQTGTQYIDTGICPDGTSVAVMDTKLDSNATRQQRFFGVSSNTYKSGKKTIDDNSAVFSFDCYINGSGYFATACTNGKGDWESTSKFTSDRVRISLSAAERHHVNITNLTSHVEIYDNTYNTTCDKTSVTTLFVFAQHFVSKGVISLSNLAQGANLYSFSMTTNSLLACDYKPCKLGDRVGVYDAVTGNIIYSSSDTDFDAANSGSPVACSLLAGETQLAAAPSATSLYLDYTWRGTAANWGDTDAWTKEGVPATWVEGNNAIFATANATATLAADVTANLLTFSADATVGGTGELTVPTVSVAEDASAVISAPIASAFEKTGAGTLTLTQNRTAATTVTEGTLKMDNATVADLTLGTYGGAPVTFDYGGQEQVKNPQDFIANGSTVTLTNGIFSTESGADLSIRDDMSPGVLPSVLTIAKGATLRETTAANGVYICKGGNGSSTINIAGGVLEKTSGTVTGFIQHKSVSGRVNINVTEGGVLRFPGNVYALCGGNIAVTSPSLYMTFSDSTFSVGGTFNFGSNYSTASNVPTTPTGVFAATNSVVSVGGDGFIVGRNKQDANTEGSYTVDFENGVVTAKTFAVYYDRPLNNARFNGTRFVFNAASGSIAASDDAANWITVGDDGLTLDTQNFSATLNAKLGGSGIVTKVGAGTLTVSRDQATTGGICVTEGTLAVTRATFAGPVAFAAGTTLNIVNYDWRTPLSAGTLELPAEGKVTLTLNGGAFPQGIYAICSAQGVTAAEGAKFAPSTGELAVSWSVDGDMLMLEVGDIDPNTWTGRAGDGNLSNPANWYGGAVPTSGTATINTSGALTVGDLFSPDVIVFPEICGAVTISGENAITGISAITNLSTSTCTFEVPVAFADEICVSQGAYYYYGSGDNPALSDGGKVRFAGGVTGTSFADGTSRRLDGSFTIIGPANCKQVSSSELWTVMNGSSLTITGSSAEQPGTANDLSWLNNNGAFTTAVIRTSSSPVCLRNEGEFVVTEELEITLPGADRHIAQRKSQGKYKFEKVTLGDNGKAGVFYFANRGDWYTDKHVYVGAGGLCFAEGAQPNTAYAFGRRANDDIYIYPWHSDYTIGAKGGTTRDIIVIEPTYFQTDDADGVARTVTLNGVADVRHTLTVKGHGRFQVNSDGLGSGGVTVTDSATLAFASGADLGAGAITVGVNATMELASGAHTFGGGLTLNDGATLAFNFTERAVTPQIAVAEGKTLTAKGTVKVMIPEGSLRPTGGEHVLTTCGGFTAENVTLVAGAPKWVNGLSVNTDGNIVLDVKPMGTLIIFR